MLNIVDAVIALNKRKQALGDHKEDIMTDSFEYGDAGEGVDRVITKVNVDGVRMMASGFDIDLAQMGFMALHMGTASTSAVMHELMEEYEDGERLIPGDVLHTKNSSSAASMWIDGLLTGMMLADLRQRYPEKDGVELANFLKGDGV